MKRIFMILTAAAMMLATAGDANAQFGKNLLNKAKEAATNAVNGNYRHQGRPHQVEEGRRGLAERFQAEVCG